MGLDFRDWKHINVLWQENQAKCTLKQTSFVSFGLSVSMGTPEDRARQKPYENGHFVVCKGSCVATDLTSV